MRDLQKGLQKSFGGPGSKRPSEVVNRSLIDLLKAAYRDIFHPAVAVVMCALSDHLHDGIGRGDELLHDRCFPSALEFYSDAIVFNFSHVHPPKMHKVHGPPAPQVISKRRPAYASLLALRKLHRTTGCVHCYPKVSLAGVVSVKGRLTQTTARKRMRAGLDHVFGNDLASRGYGLHGFRAGGVVEALLRGVPTAAIKAQGHWSLESTVMEKHARLSTAQRMQFF